MSKTLAIIGTRPQLLKVSREWADVIVNTGQHYDKNMNDVHSPKVDYNLDTTDLGEMIRAALVVILKEDPDVIVVIGDTRSTYAGAVAAKYAGKKLIHVEAGYRSGYDHIEERIRVTVDKMADAWLCTNERCVYNLAKEGVYDNVVEVGDPQFDALVATTPHTGKEWENKEKTPYNLLTIHRDEAVEHLEAILDALEGTGERFIYPIHPKFDIEKLKTRNNIEFIAPVAHKDLLRLILHAKKVVTDSGGVQREAYWMSKPLVIIRDVTEHTEIIERQCGILTGYNKKKIESAIKNFQLIGTQELPLKEAHERIKATIESI